MSKVWLNLSDIVASPEFSQQIEIERHQNGRFVKGRYQEDVKKIKMMAVVSATDEKRLEMIPEGDRNDTTKTIHTVDRIYMTQSEKSKGENKTSDVVLYNGDRYKVIAVIDADDYGFTESIISKIGVS